MPHSMPDRPLTLRELLNERDTVVKLIHNKAKNLTSHMGYMTIEEFEKRLADPAFRGLLRQLAGNQEAA